MIPDFELWLEFEIGESNQIDNRPTENFGNINVTLPDGRRYALNIWTFDFLPFARYDWPYEIIEGQEPAKYVLPPDLFVERLDRMTIETVITELLATDSMNPNWLFPPDESEDLG
jgi:hypothetical protein